MIKDIKRLPVVAHNLRSLRAWRGLTQNDVSRLAGLNRQTIVNIERGLDPTMRTLQLIAEALSVSLSTLVSDQPRWPDLR